MKRKTKLIILLSICIPRLLLQCVYMYGIFITIEPSKEYYRFGKIVSFPWVFNSEVASKLYVMLKWAGPIQDIGSSCFEVLFPVILDAGIILVLLRIFDKRAKRDQAGNRVDN